MIPRILSRFLIVTTFILFFSCEVPIEKPKGYLNPPSWIQGRWEREALSFTDILEFTSNDIMTDSIFDGVATGATSWCSYYSPITEITISDTEYVLERTQNLGKTVVVSFVYKTDTTISKSFEGGAQDIIYSK